MPDEPSELGPFLRARRERLRPADVGLPDTGRRRTPGLRREEVAALAGLSIDYLVRLEQGRDRNPSMSVVGALADALRLTDDERFHLLKLATCAPQELCTSTGAVDGVAATVHRLLDQLHPAPAFVLGPWYQVLAHNPAWAAVVAPLGMLDGDRPNLARFTFLDGRARDVLPGWEETADVQVSSLRSASVRWRGEPELVSLLDELRGVPEFDRRWSAHEVATKRRGTKVVRHPGAGELRFAYELVQLAEDGQQLICWLPADEATTAAVESLLAAGTRLRIVG